MTEISDSHDMACRREKYDSVRPAPLADADSFSGTVRLAGAFGFALLSFANRFYSVRLAYLKYPERIGNFSMDTALAFCRREEEPTGLTLFCVQQEYPIANEFLYELVARNFKLRNWLWPILRYANTQRDLPEWILAPHDPEGSRDREGILSSSTQRMEFTAVEERAAKSWLESIGWQEGEPFVCLLVRDSAYLERSLPGQSPGGWSRHDYRDSDIESYVPAAEWLADQGVWVLRMGKSMARSMPSKHPRIIDYAFRDDRSDLLDVWLFANCDLCISTGTGPDMISDVYRRPLLTVNFLPAIALWSWSNAVAAPKPLVWRDTGQRLTLDELVAANHLRSEEYSQRGIEIRDLSADSLRSIVEEAWFRVQDSWEDVPADVRRNAEAWEALERHPEYANWHGYRHPDARFSTVWLRELESGLEMDVAPGGSH